MMSVTSEPDGAPGGGPQRAGVPVADIITGMCAQHAICAAIAHRAETGIGTSTSRCRLQIAARLPEHQLLRHRLGAQAHGNLHPNIVPYQPFRTKDGNVILACANDNLYRKFCQAAGCAELADDARFASNGKRVENRAEMTRLLQEIMLERSTRDWVELLEAAGIPNGPINDLAQVYEEPQVRARGTKVELDHPIAGKMPTVASPMRFSATREYKLAPPVLSQHGSARCSWTRGHRQASAEGTI
jgi:crotonobetainyl-CoA:carnitine CoA-transferase CaiB-like acyl-CoA transferase